MRINRLQRALVSGPINKDGTYFLGLHVGNMKNAITLIAR